MPQISQSQQMVRTSSSGFTGIDPAIAIPQKPVENLSAKSGRKRKTNVETFIKRFEETGKLSGTDLARVGIHFSH